MSQYLKDKVIIVTGAASGFGRLISEKCAARGAKVVGVDVNVEGLNEVFGASGPAASKGPPMLRTSPTWPKSGRRANTPSTLTVVST
jgi:NAD(P)-dependent dehydrogenase (short-subunit alcohol dehydrogenase family)